MAEVHTRPGEIVVDSQKAAQTVHANRRFYRALSEIDRLEDIAAEVENAAALARDALAKEPDFDAFPTYIEVDSSWADELPTCVECREPVPWLDALLMPCSTIEDGDVDALGVVHRGGCPAAALHGKGQAT